LRRAAWVQPPDREERRESVRLLFVGLFRNPVVGAWQEIRKVSHSSSIPRVAPPLAAWRYTECRWAGESGERVKAFAKTLLGIIDYS
jgi:hypothetical protein